MFLLYSLLQTVQLRCESLSPAIIIIIIIKQLVYQLATMTDSKSTEIIN